MVKSNLTIYIDYNYYVGNHSNSLLSIKGINIHSYT